MYSPIFSFCRFFFTHRNGTGKLPDSVIDSILDRKLSDVICENTNSIRLVPTNAFKVVSANNPLKNCGTAEVNQLSIDGLGTFTLLNHPSRYLLFVLKY